VRCHVPDRARVQPAALCLLFNADEANASSSPASTWRICLDTGKGRPMTFAGGAELSIPEAQ
jgi:hypothetical protein